MIITAFYYMSVPDEPSPDDPLAASDVRIEVSESSEGDIDHFDYTYDVFMCTPGYLQKQVEEGDFLFLSSVVVVSRFDISVVRAALEALLPNIDDFAEKVD